MDFTVCSWGNLLCIYSLQGNGERIFEKVNFEKYPQLSSGARTLIFWYKNLIGIWYVFQLQPEELIAPSIEKTGSEQPIDSSSSSEATSETSEQIMPYSDFVYFMTKVTHNSFLASGDFCCLLMTAILLLFSGYSLCLLNFRINLNKILRLGKNLQNWKNTGLFLDWEAVCIRLKNRQNKITE